MAYPVAPTQAGGCAEDLTRTAMKPAGKYGLYHPVQQVCAAAGRKSARAAAIQTAQVATPEARHPGENVEDLWAPAAIPDRRRGRPILVQPASAATPNLVPAAAIVTVQPAQPRVHGVLAAGGQIPVTKPDRDRATCTPAHQEHAHPAHKHRTVRVIETG